MPAHFHSLGNPGNGELRSRKPEEEEMKSISGAFQFFNPVGKSATRKGGLECETVLLFCQLLQSFQHYPTGMKCCAFRIEGR